MERAVEALFVLFVFFFGGLTILVLPRPTPSSSMQFHMSESPKHLDIDKRFLKTLGTQ